MAGRCSIGPLSCLVTAQDRDEVGPPVRVEGRLVDRGIKVQASGRGARVQSLAETAQSPWTDSARAPVGGEMGRVTQPNWRVVRYADDFVILVHGTRDDVQALREEIADVLQPMGLRLSPAKTRIVHMSEALDFLGFRIQWRRKRGTSKWYVYTFIADRPVQSVKQKVRALTRRTSQRPPRDVLIRLNQIMRGWANYFRHAVCKHTRGSLENFVWHRVIRWWMRLRRWKWKDVRRRPHRPQRPVDPDRRRTGSNCSTWHRYRSSDTSTAAARSPTPGQCSTTPERQTPWRARCRETGTAGSASGLGKRTRSNPGTAPQADSTNVAVSVPQVLGIESGGSYVHLSSA